MMSLEQIRASLQSQFSAWHAMVQAFEVQMNLGRREAIDHLEHQKKLFRDGLEHLKTEVERSQGLLGAQREALNSAFDEMRVQLSLGRAETRDLFHAQQKSLLESISKLDAELGRNLGSLTDTMGTEYVRWVDAVKAEFEAASAHFSQVRERQQENWEASRTVFEKQLEVYRHQLEEARKHAMEQAKHYQKSLADGMQQLHDSFMKLFDTSGKDNK